VAVKTSPVSPTVELKQQNDRKKRRTGPRQAIEKPEDYLSSVERFAEFQAKLFPLSEKLPIIVSITPLFRRGDRLTEYLYRRRLTLLCPIVKERL
jgi:hypothetical protein